MVLFFNKSRRAEAVKRRLASADVARIALLREAFKNWQDALEVSIHTLKNESWQAQCAAYSIIPESAETELKRALEAYNEFLNILTGHSVEVRFVAISPNGQTIASRSYNNTIKVSNLRTGELRSIHTENASLVNFVAISPDGQTFATASWDKTIKVWDIGTGRVKSTLTGHLLSVKSVAFSPDGQTLASSSDDTTIKVWDIGTSQVKRTFTGHLSSVKSVAFSPDGQTLASGSDDNTVKLWEVSTGELKSTLTGHSSSIYSSVAFSPDGQTLASGSGDGSSIKLWNVRTGKQQIPLTGHSSVEFFKRYLALKDALKSGQASLDLVIQALKDKSWEVYRAAYLLLQQREEPRVKQLLQPEPGGTQYVYLKYLLGIENWKEAEKETENILLNISGCERGADLKSIVAIRITSTQAAWSCSLEDVECNIPDQDLRTIYDLWKNYSNGRSSFSEQRSSLNFWIECEAQIEYIWNKRIYSKSEYEECVRDSMQSVFGGPKQ